MLAADPQERLSAHAAPHDSHQFFPRPMSEIGVEELFSCHLTAHEPHSLLGAGVGWAMERLHVGIVIVKQSDRAGVTHRDSREPDCNRPCVVRASITTADPVFLNVS